MNNINCADVSAVLVTYNPSVEHLHLAIRAVLPQVANVFIVDNASSNFSQDWIDALQSPFLERTHLLPQSENLGLGAAHNIGIKCAIEHGAKYILLLDQDSLVGPDMVVRLRDAYLSQGGAASKIAALGPQYADAEGGMLSRFVKVGLFRFTHHACVQGVSVIDADFLVSSGALLPVDAINRVGLMDEGLFIDHVDTEWCFRAKAQGMRILGVCGAIMTHELGEERVEVWILRKRIIPFHKPFRYYYMFRNSVLLYKRGYLSWRWKLADIARCLKIAIFFCLASGRLARLKMMLLGVFDGMKDIYGKRNF